MNCIILNLINYDSFLWVLIQVTFISTKQFVLISINKFNKYTRKEQLNIFDLRWRWLRENYFNNSFVITFRKMIKRGTFLYFVNLNFVNNIRSEFQSCSIVVYPIVLYTKCHDHILICVAPIVLQCWWTYYVQNNFLRWSHDT